MRILISKGSKQPRLGARLGGQASRVTLYRPVIFNPAMKGRADILIPSAIISRSISSINDKNSSSDEISNDGLWSSESPLLFDVLFSVVMIIISSKSNYLAKLAA